MKSQHSDTSTILTQTVKTVLNNTNELYIVQQTDKRLIEKSDDGQHSITLNEIFEVEQCPESYPEEYEQWSELGNGSNLPEEVNTPCGIATNEYHTANQTTYSRGSKMYANSISASALNEHPTPLKHSSFAPNITKINTQYLGSALSEVVAVHRVACIRSGMGTGKTTAIKPLLLEYGRVFYCCPNKKLARAMAEDLSLTYYEDYKRETNLIKRGEMSGRIVGTPQMLALLLKHDKDLSFDLVVFDESESAAGLIVSDACKNKVEVIGAISTVVARSSRVVFMDADLGCKTEALMRAVGLDGHHRLENSFKRWSGIDAVILDGSSYKVRKQKILAMIEGDIKSGRKIAITTSSKQYAQRVKGVISKLAPDARVILVDSDSNTPEVISLMDDTGRLVNYDVLIYTPAIGSGVSFDIKGHIDRVYGVFTNNKRTGGTQDAMQAMARVRHPKDKQWILALDDAGRVYNALGDVAGSSDIMRITGDVHSEMCFYGKIKTEVNQALLNLHSELVFDKKEDKNSFNERLSFALRSEEVRISKLSVDDVSDSLLAESAECEVREEVREKSIGVRTQSPKLTDDEASTIKARLKFRPDEVTQVERESLERFRFEAKYNICCDEVEDIDHYIELDDSGAIEKCINREIAQADSVFVKRYIKALVSGLGEGGAFKVDVTSKKIAFNLKRKLYAHALKYSDGCEYSHRSLKRSAMVRWIHDNRLALGLYEVIDIPKDWRAKPALIVNRLLDSMGFDHDYRKSKKDGNLFSAYSNESISGLIDERATSGNTWTERTSKLMDLFDTADDGVIAEGLARIAEVDGLDMDIRNHVEGCLFKLPVSMHDLALDEYLRISSQDRNPDVRLSPVALANLYLLDLAKKHGLRHAA